MDKEFLLKCIDVIENDEKLNAEFRKVYGTSFSLLRTAINDDLIKPSAIELITKLGHIGIKSQIPAYLEYQKLVEKLKDWDLYHAGDEVALALDDLRLAILRNVNEVVFDKISSFEAIKDIVQTWGKIHGIAIPQDLPPIYSDPASNRLIVGICEREIEVACYEYNNFVNLIKIPFGNLTNEVSKTIFDIAISYSIKKNNEFFAKL